jgi:uncharacterized protein (DUF58 family)
MNKENVGGTLFFFTGLVFVMLKLAGVIDWSWWIVTMPWWIGVGIMLAILVTVLTVVLGGILAALVGVGLWTAFKTLKSSVEAQHRREEADRFRNAQLKKTVLME